MNAEVKHAGKTKSQPCLQAEKESEVSHHRSPNMVHPDRPGYLKAFHQVRRQSGRMFIHRVP